MEPMRRTAVQAFIKKTAKRAVENVKTGVYSADKAVGALGALSNLAAQINDLDLMAQLAGQMYEARAETNKQMEYRRQAALDDRATITVERGAGV
jgi:hypothetical protein